jgi:transcriptional regulator with XRE-family HTH domain
MRKQTYELYASANKRLALNVRRLLKDKEWTVERLATEADQDKGNIYNMLNGRINFTMRAVVRIERALGVDLSELFKK